jgi:ubiquitin-conjugating enzyme E2 R
MIRNITLISHISILEEFWKQDMSKQPIADASKALQKHYNQRYQKDGHPHFLMAIKPDDIKTWYVLFLNMEGPYASGEFLMKLEAPDNYPFSPPTFTFMTPNNRFKTDGKPCVDMGHYHSDNWSPQTGMYGFTVQIYYALNMPMDSLGGGIGIYTAKEQSDDQKKDCAKSSLEYNKKNYKEIMELFDDERLRHQETVESQKLQKTQEKDTSTNIAKVSKSSKPTKNIKKVEESEDSSSLSIPDSESESNSESDGPAKPVRSAKSTQKTKSAKSVKDTKKNKQIEDAEDDLSSLSDLSEEVPKKSKSKTISKSKSSLPKKTVKLEKPEKKEKTKPVKPSKSK